MQVQWQVSVNAVHIASFFLKKQLDRIEKKKASVFLNKKKTDRSNIIRLESARFRGSKMMDDMFVFLPILEDGH